MSQQVAEFWMVWNPARKAPAFRHQALELAQAEARRLAALAPGEEFYVLRAIDGYRMPQPGPERIIIDDGIPF